MTATPATPELLDQARGNIRLKHCSIRTGKDRGYPQEAKAIVVAAAHHFSIACRQPGIPPWVDGAVEAVVAYRFAAQRGCADQDAGGVVGGLRVAQLVPHADQQLARVGAEGEGFDFGGFR